MNFVSLYLTHNRNLSHVPMCGRALLTPGVSLSGEAEHPTVLASLLPPADSADWIRFIEELGLQQYEAKLESLRLLYCVHNGQSSQLDRLLDSGDVDQALKHHLDIFSGLLGGYSVYDHMPCSRLFSLEKSVHATHEMRQMVGPQMPQHYFVIGGSYDMRKQFFCDAATLDVFVTAPAQQMGMFPAHPPAEGQRTAVDVLNGTADGLLRWLEEYSRRLEQRRYRATELVRGAPPTRAISLFPASKPFRCCVVHRDIEVSAAALYAPELGRYVYTVSIRMLVEGVDSAAIGAAARGFSDCQLRGRAWEMHGPPGSEPRRAGGIGVVGRCPLLLADGQWRDDALDGNVQPTDGRLSGQVLGAAVRPGSVQSGVFTYQSATDHMPTSSIVGCFSFVPGSLRRPDGEQFEVTIGPVVCGGDHMGAEYIF